ncbi:aldehyde dehydrogenase family protein [Dasania marina]|uniref:aldehyde dehydrogenase family protein n=1 Tax=Dasania marina TaxID=471499 RepID=UPI00037FB214|nr:aldehyde dehydrogenase family protein [Dasania marina]
MIDEMIAKARIAQAEYATFSQEQVDEIVRAIGKVIYDNAEELARNAVAETRMGNVEDKLVKKLGKSRAIWNSLKGKRSIGVIEERDEDGLVKIAKPVGVVGAVTPTTNPVVTPMCNAMFALKGGNAIIIAPHPRAKKCSAQAVDLMNGEIKRLGGPDNLIQCITEPSIAATNELMQKVDVLVATGGPAMVTAAYSSGKPSFGVGPGNVQVIIDTDVDYNDAAAKVVAGRKFDYGIICSGEQSVIAQKDDYNKVIEAFKANGAHYVEDQETADKLRAAIFEDGHIAADAVGQSPQRIAEMAGISIADDAKVILIKSNGRDDDILRKEKMCPVLVAHEYSDFDNAIAIAQQNLGVEGKGHTCAIHSNNDEHIRQAGLALPVSRLVVNEASSLTAGGSLKNGFAPTTTLGCGSWGNNSISENLNYHHLINVHRTGYAHDKPAPTDEEIWS